MQTLCVFLLKLDGVQSRKKSFGNSLGRRSRGVQQPLRSLLSHLRFPLLPSLAANAESMKRSVYRYFSRLKPYLRNHQYSQQLIIFSNVWRNDSDLQRKRQLFKTIHSSANKFVYHSFLYPDVNRPAIGHLLKTLFSDNKICVYKCLL